MKSFFIKVGILLGAWACAFAASAQQPLSAEEIKKISVGNTVEVTQFVPKNTRYKNYFEADGSALSLNEDGQENRGKWRITEDGRHCTQWGGRGENCVQIIKEPDGTYKRVADGVVRAIWSNITPGKAF